MNSLGKFIVSWFTETIRIKKPHSGPIRLLSEAVYLIMCWRAILYLTVGEKMFHVVMLKLILVKLEHLRLLFRHHCSLQLDC